MGYAKYEEDDKRRTEDNLFIQERIAIVPWVWPAPVHPKPSGESHSVLTQQQDRQESPTPYRRAGRASTYVWFAHGIKVMPTPDLANAVKPFWNGHLFKLPFQKWITLGQPPAGSRGSALVLPKIRRWCEITQEPRGGVIRVLPGSAPIYIRNYRIRIARRFFLRDLDSVLSGVFFVTRLPSGPPAA